MIIQNLFVTRKWLHFKMKEYCIFTKWNLCHILSFSFKTLSHRFDTSHLFLEIRGSLRCLARYNAQFMLDAFINLLVFFHAQLVLTTLALCIHHLLIKLFITQFFICIISNIHNCMTGLRFSFNEF